MPSQTEVGLHNCLPLCILNDPLTLICDKFSEKALICTLISFVSDICYRLNVQSRPLDVVYNPVAVEWLVDFFTRPHQSPDAQLRRAARHRYEIMKQKTKQEFIRNWEQILEGKLVILC